jgi:hypothetical protein
MAACGAGAAGGHAGKSEANEVLMEKGFAERFAKSGSLHGIPMTSNAFLRITTTTLKCRPLSSRRWSGSLPDGFGAKRQSAHIGPGASIWSVRTPHGPVAARVSSDRLILAEPGSVRVLILASGEDEWHAKASGEVVVAGGRLLVPEASHTSHVYSLHDSVAKKLKTSVALARPVSPSVRIVDGTLVATVTGAGAVVLVDLPDAVEADRTAPIPRGRVTGAWLAGPFLITTPPFSVAHLWGGIATSIPLDMDPLTGALPAQALVRGDRSAWLEFS